MSADNWAVCPQCISIARGAAERVEQEVMAGYGKLPLDEFDARRAELGPVDEEKYRTFREDYEFSGAEEGEIEARYAGHCSVCNLKCELYETRKFWPVAELTEHKERA